MKSRVMFLIAASLMFVSNLTYAYAVSLVNASFESDTPAGGGWSGTAGTTDGQWKPSLATGWTGAGTYGTWRPGTGMFGSIPDGVQVAYLGSSSSIAQTTAEILQAGYTYTLTVMVGTRDNAAVGGTDASFAGGKIELLADGNVIDFVTSTTPAQGGWVSTQLIFTATNLTAGLGKALTVRLSGLTGGIQTNFDKVSLTAVPLPAAAWLFGSALLGLGWARRSRSRQQEVLGEKGTDLFTEKINPGKINPSPFIIH